MQNLARYPNMGAISNAPAVSWRRIAVIAAVVGLTYAALARYIIGFNDPVNAGAGFWPAAGVTLAALLMTPRGRRLCRQGADDLPIKPVRNAYLLRQRMDTLISDPDLEHLGIPHPKDGNAPDPAR